MKGDGTTTRALTTLPGDALRVTAGANLGDGLAPAAEMAPCDTYRLAPEHAAPRELRLVLMATPPYAIAPDSKAGRPGNLVHLDCCATLMADDGATVDLLVLAETDGAGMLVAVHAAPLGPIAPGCDYTLVRLDRDALARFAQVKCVSFTRGTRIARADGAQVPVEDLRPGTRILTRDSGPQPLRWIGQHTVRASGALAPILIRAGTLNNDRDLLVSPDHRLMVYQRRDALGAGRSEILVRARQLVNGTTVTRVEGGFVDYFQMLFDSHQIVFAEGVAAESLLVDAGTTAVLPDDCDPDALIPAHSRSNARALELGDGVAPGGDLADRLRRASEG
jgi:hypothetical protein